jgi:hypothetical protein
MDSKRVNDVSSQPFYKAVVFFFLFYQMIKQKKVGEAYTKLYFYNGVTIIVSFGCIIHTTIYPIIHLSRPRLKKLLEGSSPSFFRCSDDDDASIYVETGVVVVISYVLLLGVNWDYIWLAAFPLIAIGFIFTLRDRLSRQQSGLQKRRDDDGRQQGSEEEIEKAEAAALVLYWVLCIMGSFHISDSLAVSQFLVFFSFVLGALTRMMTRLALTRAGVAPASLLLRKASLVVLLATLHAFAAELLGENVVLFLLPELAPILLWLSVHMDRRDDGSSITADEIKSHGNVVAALGAAVFASLAASVDELVFAWCTRTLVSCAVSALLVYYVVFMLCQWPGVDATAAAPFVEEAIKLLKLWANTLLTAAAALLVFVVLAAVWLGLFEQMVAERLNFFSEFVIRSSVS